MSAIDWRLDNRIALCDGHVMYRMTQRRPLAASDVNETFPHITNRGVARQKCGVDTHNEHEPITEFGYGVQGQKGHQGTEPPKFLDVKRKEQTCVILRILQTSESSS